LTDLLETRTDECESPVYTTCWEVTACPRSDYVACQAFQQRKNCYELDRVVCCSKHRDNCSACPVYVTINRVPVEPLKVRVCTDRFDITGVLHLPAGARLSDYVNKGDRPFLVVTDAQISPVNAPGQVARNRFAVINKSHIVLAHLLDEE